MQALQTEAASRLLLVEDSLTDTKMVLSALASSPLNKKVEAMVDGEQAMSYLRTLPEDGRPDLILLDLNLPRKDGWEVLAECKADPSLKSIPIVVFTTSLLESDVRRCYELGANSFVAKPFELQPFFECVRSIEKYWLTVSAKAV